MTTPPEKGPLLLSSSPARPSRARTHKHGHALEWALEGFGAAAESKARACPSTWALSRTRQYVLALLPFLLAGARCICAALSGEGRPLTLGSRTRRKPAGEAIGVVMPAPALGFFCCLSCTWRHDQIAHERPSGRLWPWSTHPLDLDGLLATRCELLRGLVLPLSHRAPALRPRPFDVDWPARRQHVVHVAVHDDRGRVR